MTPENAIFRKIYAECELVGDTFDYLPDGDTEYPFIYVGRTTNVGENNSDLIGTVNIALDIYGLRSDRNTLDGIQVALHNVFIRLDEAFMYNIRLVSENSEVRPDNTDRQPLTRVMINLDIQYTKKER